MEDFENDFFYSPYGLRIWQLRHDKVAEILNHHKVDKVSFNSIFDKKVMDLGCNDGKFIKFLL